MNRRDMARSLAIGIGLLLALVAPWPALQRARADDGQRDKTTTASVQNLKKLGVALLMYAQDYDELLPPMKDAAVVKKVLLPYVRRDESVFIQPETREPYRPNAGVSQRRMAVLIYPKSRRRPVSRGKPLNPGELPQTVAFYEASPATDGTRGVLFLDGRVRRVSADEWERVKRASRVPD